MQLGHHDFSGRATKFIVFVNVGRNPAAIIGNRYRVIRVNGDDDVVTIATQCLVNRIIQNFKHHVVQTRAIGGVTDVHPRAFAHGFQTFEHFD